MKNIVVVLGRRFPGRPILEALYFVFELKVSAERDFTT
jgi:hypothetical protein